MDLGQFDDSYIRELRKQLAQTGRRLWVLDITSDLGIPTFIAITHWMQDGRENIEFGSGAHFDARIALMRALTELNQFLSLGLMGGGTGEKSSLDGINPLRLEDHPYLIPGGVSLAQPDFGVKFGHLDTHEQVAACVALTKQAGLDFLVLDQTRPDIEVPVVRVIVPHLRHFYRRFAPGRLYDVPAKLGLRDRPIPETSLIRFTRIPESHQNLRAPEPKRVRRTVPAHLAARLRGDVALDAQASGELFAYADGYPVSMGRFSAGAAERARELRKGLSFASFSGSSRKIEKELSLLVRRLAESGFLVYCLSRSGKGEDLVVIEPQVQGYWPCMPQIGAADRLVLSRLAYLRRRGSELVLELPHAGALFKICDPKIASALAMLSMPRQIKELRRQDDFPGPELLALLLDCGILFKADAGSNGLRIDEGDQNLVFSALPPSSLSYA